MKKTALFLLILFIGFSCRKPKIDDNKEGYQIVLDSCSDYPPSPNPGDYVIEEAPKNWEMGAFNPLDNDQIVYYFFRVSDTFPSYHYQVFRTWLSNPGDTLRLYNGPLFPSSWNRNGWILGTDFSGRLLKIRPDGSNLTEIKTGATNIGWADWSPEGEKIIFNGARNRYGGLYLVNTDGSGLRQFDTLHADDPKWSPDGKKIAYAALSNIYSSDTLNHTRTFKGVIQGACRGISWFPDSKWIVYADDDGLFKLDTETGNSIHLCSGCSSRTYSAPVVSPDGSRILATRVDYDVSVPRNLKKVFINVWSINADGNNLHKLDLKGPNQ